MGVKGVILSRGQTSWCPGARTLHQCLPPHSQQQGLPLPVSVKCLCKEQAPGEGGRLGPRRTDPKASLLAAVALALTEADLGNRLGSYWWDPVLSGRLCLVCVRGAVVTSPPRKGLPVLRFACPWPDPDPSHLGHGDSESVRRAITLSTFCLSRPLSFLIGI